MEARGLEEAGQPEHRRGPRLRRKRLHRRGDGEGEASLVRICFSRALFDRQSSDVRVPMSKASLFEHRRRKCSLLSGPGLFARKHKRPKRALHGMQPFSKPNRNKSSQ